jgi:hypothetical protein
MILVLKTELMSRIENKKHIKGRFSTTLFSLLIVCQNSQDHVVSHRCGRKPLACQAF